jgi:hypothetical protein
MGKLLKRSFATGLVLLILNTPVKANIQASEQPYSPQKILAESYRSGNFWTWYTPLAAAGYLIVKRGRRRRNRKR